MQPNDVEACTNTRQLLGSTVHLLGWHRPNTAGRSSNRLTAPSVARSIWIARSALMALVPLSHWETRPCVAGVPVAVRRAADAA